MVNNEQIKRNVVIFLLVFIFIFILNCLNNILFERLEIILDVKPLEIRNEYKSIKIQDDDLMSNKSNDNDLNNEYFSENLVNKDLENKNLKDDSINIDINTTKLTDNELRKDEIKVDFTCIEKRALFDAGDIVVEIEAEKYKITNLIPIEQNYLYKVMEVQTNYSEEDSNYTACYLFDENKNLIKKAYGDYRFVEGIYTHVFEATPDATYFRILFQMTDTDIEITKTYLDRKLEYESESYIQGIAISENYLFTSYCLKGADKNSYRIQKINRETGEIIQTTDSYFNHANGMTYNKNTNELLIIALDGNSERENYIGEDAFSLYRLDAEEFVLKDVVNLKDVILRVCKESTGISSAAYSSSENEYYVLTRYPKRYIIVLNEDFSYKRSIYLPELEEEDKTIGDMCADDKYFYIPIWYFGKNNKVKIYDKQGNIITTKRIDGITHIEGIDKLEDRYYISFIDFNSNMSAVVYSMINIADVIK